MNIVCDFIFVDCNNITSLCNCECYYIDMLFSEYIGYVCQLHQRLNYVN